ncbi:hypothetical protein Golob_025392 [Gossypium lobatum]|uniref:Uncharacterized protein n=1 Tax=Gossypium lobatum TaxID=34289 RepID=A0A7J8NKI2_9ROSI|nr:hypothetical protein [Gossypium lobatum]
MPSSVIYPVKLSLLGMS